MSHWSTRRLLTSLADLLANGHATRRSGGYGEPVRLLLSPRLAERLAAALNAAAASTDPLLDEEPPTAAIREEEGTP